MLGQGNKAAGKESALERDLDLDSHDEARENGVAAQKSGTVLQQRATFLGHSFRPVSSCCV